jgi:hypothetical protein
MKAPLLQDVGNANLLFFQNYNFFFFADLRRRKAWSPQGVPAYLVHRHIIEPKPLNIMSMIQLREEAPIFSYLVKKTTTADDLLHFVMKAKENNYLKKGDFLIMDNSSVHLAEYTTDRLIQLMNEIGFNLVFLPAYSPELNPIELIFGIIKNSIRHNLGSNSVFTDVVASAFANISLETVFNCYVRCIIKPIIE